jgi:DNA-binding transcriptional LysR family regulator
MDIRQLEQELGVPIVERGQRFHGLTPEGERVLKWAHAILDNWGSLQQEIAKLRNTKGTLIGRLSLGVVLRRPCVLGRTGIGCHPLPAR